MTKEDIIIGIQEKEIPFTCGKFNGGTATLSNFDVIKVETTNGVPQFVNQIAKDGDLSVEKYTKMFLEKECYQNCSYHQQDICKSNLLKGQ